ncbi:MAG: hypothetical protein VR64_08310 [Desulfatitalea sp. BRH_c12]|nr:MAG: hypothetical protein VR64_08310 [Desulfatitalea sp. BRH_c12]
MDMILRRYIFKELWPPFGISLIFFSFIFVMSQLHVITDYVVNFQIGIATVVLFILYSMPFFLQFTIPMSVMIAVLLTFLRMSADMEIVALKAAGVHLYRLLPPVIVFGLIGALLTAYMAIFAQPQGRKESKLLLQRVASAHLDVGLKPRQFIDAFKDMVLYVHQIDSNTKVLSDVFIEDHRSDKTSITVIAPRGQLSFDADNAVVNLRLFDGALHETDLRERRVNTLHFVTYDVRLDMSRSLEAINSGEEHVREMSLAKLYQTVQSTQKGDRYYKALKEWHKKFSMPAACLVMALLAMPLGIQARSAQRAYGIGLGLGFFLLYYILLTVGWVLGESGFYPPWLGMWLPNAILLVMGAYMLMRAAKEKPLALPQIPQWIRRLQLNVRRN